MQLYLLKIVLVSGCISPCFLYPQHEESGRGERHQRHGHQLGGTQRRLALHAGRVATRHPDRQVRHRVA